METRFNGIDYDNPNITLSYVQGYFTGKKDRVLSSKKEAEDRGQLLARQFDCPDKSQYREDFYKGYMDAVKEFNLMGDRKMGLITAEEDLIIGTNTLKTLGASTKLCQIFREYYYNKDFLEELKERYIPKDKEYGSKYFYNKLGVPNDPYYFPIYHSLITLLMNRAWKLYEGDWE
jgi:hypothetical protein